ncbi:MAG: two-component regulator propeller domain-containing protein [Ignavibacteriaceae bacterium]|jgi:photosystem II stability/assembly factor-like uncharacterized protein|nr:two-component regulator propeller domain-containing protein [Ignavibacteriaceae bacterium]
MCNTLKIIVVVTFFTYYTFPQNIIWQHTGGPMGGIVEGMDIASNGDIYAGGFSFNESYSGLYKSSDNGESWTKIKTQFEDFEVYCIYISKDNSIWVGTDYQDRIYRSTDNGNTWQARSNNFLTFECWVIGENNSGVLYAGDGNQGRLYRSTDEGMNWIFSAYLSPLSICATSDNITFLGDFNGLYYSINDGVSWYKHSGFSNPVSSIIIDSLNNIYCGTGYYNNGDGVFYSNDNGKTFNYLGLQGKVVLSLALDSYGNLYAGTLNDGLFRTSDNGNTWQQFSNGIYKKAIYRLKINKQNDIFIGSEGGGTGWEFYGSGGVFRSANSGESFKHIGLPNSNVKNIVFSGDSLLIAATPSGVQKFNRLTKDWENIGLHNVESVSITSSNLIYAATSNEGLFRSEDFGKNWDYIKIAGDTLPLIFNVLALSEDTVFISPGNQVNFRMTTDGGNSWEIYPIKSSGILIKKIISYLYPDM